MNSIATAGRVVSHTTRIGAQSRRIPRGEFPRRSPASRLALFRLGLNPRFSSLLAQALPSVPNELFYSSASKLSKAIRGKLDSSEEVVTARFKRIAHRRMKKIRVFIMLIVFVMSKAIHALPAITRHPGSVVVPEGTSATFTTTAIGSGALSFQWRLRGSDIPTATNSTYHIISTSVANLGQYSVTVSDSADTVESKVATLSLIVTVRPDFAPDLKIKANAEGVALTWKGEAVVERASNVAGPWAASAGARKNTFTETLVANAAFYRLRNPHPRTVGLFLPSSFRPEAKPPLLVFLHGYGRTGDFYESVYQIRPLAEEKGFLYALPEGVSDHLGLRYWNAWKTCCDFDDMQVDDVGFLRSLVRKIRAEYHPDSKRIYFAGHSNGAFMSFRMAQESPDLIASIAAISGTMDENADIPASPTAVSVLQIHGVADQAVLYDGGKLGLGLPDRPPYASARLVTERWAAWNGCAALGIDSSMMLDLETSVAGLDTVVTRNGCPGGVSVEHWSIQKAGHDLNIAPDFSRRVVDWLLAHPKP